VSLFFGGLTLCNCAESLFFGGTTLCDCAVTLFFGGLTLSDCAVSLFFGGLTLCNCAVSLFLGGLTLVDVAVNFCNKAVDIGYCGIAVCFGMVILPVVLRYSVKAKNIVFKICVKNCAYCLLKKIYLYIFPTVNSSA